MLLQAVFDQSSFNAILLNITEYKFSRIVHIVHSKHYVFSSAQKCTTEVTPAYRSMRHDYITPTLYPSEPQVFTWGLSRSF